MKSPEYRQRPKLKTLQATSTEVPFGSPPSYEQPSTKETHPSALGHSSIAPQTQELQEEVGYLPHSHVGEYLWEKLSLAIDEGLEQTHEMGDHVMFPLDETRSGLTDYEVLAFKNGHYILDRADASGESITVFCSQSELNQFNSRQ